MEVIIDIIIAFVGMFLPQKPIIKSSPRPAAARMRVVGIARFWFSNSMECAVSQVSSLATERLLRFQSDG